MGQVIVSRRAICYFITLNYRSLYFIIRFTNRRHKQGRTQAYGRLGHGPGRSLKKNLEELVSESG
jgi:hypothetical protein